MVVPAHAGESGGLGAVHAGYLHQDLLTACALVSLHFPSTPFASVLADAKLHDRDLFDDLTLDGTLRHRRQIKWHKKSPRPLTAADLRTKAIDCRIDDMVASFLADVPRADEYRLVTTFNDPDPDMMALLEEDPTAAAASPGLPTKRFRLAAEVIWPATKAPIWTPLRRTEREAFLSFCDRFVIETGCPRASLNLRQPGDLEEHLLDLLTTRLGLGLPPNDARDVGDAAAHVIYLAMSARADKRVRLAHDVTDALALTTNYNRVPEVLPIDPDVVVPLPGSVRRLVSALGDSSTIVLRGPPGAGKSWLLHATRDHMLRQGVLVATHYCFVDLHDPMRDRRSNIDVVFGSLIAELYDLDPSLVPENVPRYAAGPRELEQILASACASRPELRISLIVDGLDHADRLSQPGRGQALDIVQELGELDLPAGVTLLVGSQPGDHLSPLLGAAGVIECEPWEDLLVGTLMSRLGISERGLGDAVDVDEVQRTIIEKAEGNPLYATYLARTALAMAAGEMPAGEDVGVVPYLRRAPAFDPALSDYYAWLLDAIEEDTGAVAVVNLLALVGFPVTADELGEIVPPLASQVGRVLSLLSPVLQLDPATGRRRVYHESFQRFVLTRVDDGPGRAATLKMALAWLDSRGSRDVRVFRWSWTLLQSIGDSEEILRRCDVEYVARAAADGHPGDGVLANLATAAQAAVRVGSLPALARIVELSRAADHIWRWRFEDDDLAQRYGVAFAALYGGEELAARLLHDGRPTFRPRPGIVLCDTCDREGAVPPWSQYIGALERLRATDNTVYSGGELHVDNARVIGVLRLATVDEAEALTRSWLSNEAATPVHPFDAAHSYGVVAGADGLAKLTAELPAGATRGWAKLATAYLTDADAVAAGLATEVVQEDADDLGLEGLRMALDLGADLSTLAARFDLDALTDAVVESDARSRLPDLVAWLLALDITTQGGSGAELSRVEKQIPASFWYRRWLQFAVRLRYQTDPVETLEALRAIAQDIDRNIGTPRVIDLYSVRDEVKRTFRTALARMPADLYPIAIGYVFAVADAGVFQVDDVLEMLIRTGDTEAKRAAASTEAAARLHPDRRGEEVYDTHAGHQFLLTVLHARAGQGDLAEAAWQEGCTFLAGYGFRKDITIFEVIDPLPALGAAAPDRMPVCLAAVQRPVEALLAHTDLRETRWAIHQWADAAAALHPSGGLMHVARTALASEPSVGDLDHAMARGAAALFEQVDDAVLQAFWVALGPIAGERVEAALRQCEQPTMLRDDAWRLLTASLLGDTEAPSADTARLVEDSAARLEVTPPAVPSLRKVKDSIGTSPPRQTGATELSVPFTLGVDASPARVAHAVRRWRARPNRSTVGEVSDLVLGRLIEIATGDADEARWLLHRIAADTPQWESDTLLADLAAGLEEQGYVSLAAVAYTLAYTRRRDGWRRFAGTKEQSLFTQALGLDAALAWATLTTEVADGVTDGAEHGITVHLLELLAAGGRVDDAFACWDESLAVIDSRLPSVGPWDAPNIRYDAAADDVYRALGACLVARLAHITVTAREAALAGIGLLARLTTESAARVLGGALDIAAELAPPSVLQPLLCAVELHEPAPFAATVRAAGTLHTLAACDLVSIRTVAGALLQRAGVDVPPLPATDLALAPKADDAHVRDVIEFLGMARLAAVQTVWGGFARVAVDEFDTAIRSEESITRHRAAAERLHLPYDHDGVGFFMPACEERERALQRAGAVARTRLALKGQVNPAIDGAIGRALLVEHELSLQWALSRAPRPGHHPDPAQARTEAVADLTVVRDGPHAGWVVLAHHESLCRPSDDVLRAAVQDRVVWSAVTTGPDVSEIAEQLASHLPLGRGNVQSWLDAMPDGPPVPGLLVDLDITHGSFSVLQLLIPSAFVLAVATLLPAPDIAGLVLLDVEAEPAIILRRWADRLLDDEHLSGAVHLRSGSEVLIRRDVFDSILAEAVLPAVTVTIVHE